MTALATTTTEEGRAFLQVPTSSMGAPRSTSAFSTSTRRPLPRRDASAARSTRTSSCCCSHASPKTATSAQRAPATSATSSPCWTCLPGMETGGGRSRSRGSRPSNSVTAPPARPTLSSSTWPGDRTSWSAGPESRRGEPRSAGSTQERCDAQPSVHPEGLKSMGSSESPISCVCRAQGARIAWAETRTTGGDRR